MKHLIESVKQSMMNNEFNIFEGPIYDQNHVLKSKAGETLDYEDIIHMDWLIEGVEGEIPNLRTLTPIEAERIQMFPDNWTKIESKAMTERRRYFMMGNALVVGVVQKLGDYLSKIVDEED